MLNIYNFSRSHHLPEFLFLASIRHSVKLQNNLLTLPHTLRVPSIFNHVLADFIEKIQLITLLVSRNSEQTGQFVHNFSVSYAQLLISFLEIDAGIPYTPAACYATHALKDDSCMQRVVCSAVEWDKICIDSLCSKGEPTTTMITSREYWFRVSGFWK